MTSEGPRDLEVGALPETVSVPRLTSLEFFGLLRWIDRTPLLDHVEPYRRRIFEAVLDEQDADGRPQHNLALCGRAKKNWKSADLVLAALFAVFANDSRGGNQAYVLANDEGQAGDDLTLAKRLVEANPMLGDLAMVRQKVIERRDGRGFLMILPAQDVAGTHGKTFRFAGFDEIHAYRTWDILEALQPDPTRPDAQTWITSYASIYHRPGVPLFDLCAQGRAGPDPRMFYSWYAADHTTDPTLADADPETRANPSRASWAEQGYLDQQRRRLPAHKFRRLHLNLPGLPEGSVFQPEPVMNAIDRGVRHRDADTGTHACLAAFVDMSGGSRDDAVLGIAGVTADGQIELLRLRNQGPPPPFDPRDAVARFVAELRRYGIHRVCGDRYAGQTFQIDFMKQGISYEVAAVTKHGLYEMFEPALNAGEIRLLDEPVLEQQLLGLVWRGGKIDHASGEHDDWANAAVGACLLARERAEADPAAYEMSADERAQMRALQREWGVPGAGIFDSDGRRLEDDVVYDEDLGMAMDDPEYPRRW